MTREGVYRLMTFADYSRQVRVGYVSQGPESIPVKVSFVGQSSNDNEKIAFNYGRELFVYPYRGAKRTQDSKFIDKRIYKGTSPSCHDFGEVGCVNSEKADMVPLLVGFTGGEIHLIDPVTKSLSKLFNEERMIDKTKVTCIRWVPQRGDMFLVSHASGSLYTYLANSESQVLAPQYQLIKQGESYTYYTCKTKPPRNPISKCSLTTGAVNEFSFSPCGEFLAVVSQDGFLRIFNFESMDLTGTAKSYFGGLHCVCWSPDGRYVVIGGEDDLVHVYSVNENRIVLRGQGHRSWVSVVMFDLYNLSYGDVPDGLDFSGSDDEGAGGGGMLPVGLNSQHSVTGGGISDLSNSSSLNIVRGAKCTVPPQTSEGPDNCNDNATLNSGRNSETQDTSENSGAGEKQKNFSRENSLHEQNVTCYRFGSVGQDTSLCLWDFTEDLVKTHLRKINRKKEEQNRTTVNEVPEPSPANNSAVQNNTVEKNNSSSSLTHKLASLNFGGISKDSSGHKRAFSLPSRSEKKEANIRVGGSLTKSGVQQFQDHKPKDLIGTPGCPRLSETPVMEPIVMKKVAHERLTSLVFRQDSLVTACQDGYVCTWARPGHINSGTSAAGGGQHGQLSPGAGAHLEDLHQATGAGYSGAATGGPGTVV